MNPNDPNYHILARVIHEQRIEEALQRQRHWQPRANEWLRANHWRINLGNRLIALGMRLKTEIDPTPQVERSV